MTRPYDHRHNDPPRQELKMDRNDKQAADKPLIEAIRGKLDNATRMITSLQAEIAALRGDLPEGWAARTNQVWLLCAGDEGSVWAPTEAGELYEWESCEDGKYINAGAAPTLLEAIAACEAARGAK